MCKQIAKGKDLIFISRIERDGLSLVNVSDQDMSFEDDETFNINGLSLTNGLYTASRMNVYVVKFKPHMPNTKQHLTAMQLLREKLLERIKSDSCSEYEENILNEITHSINTELLATERQQHLNTFNESRFHHPMVGFKHDTAEQYVDNTFKTQE